MQPRSALACFPVLSKQVLDQYQEVDIGVIRTEALAKSWTVDSPRGTERAASPLQPPPHCCFCTDSWAFARAACCNPRDLLSFPANSVYHSLRLLHPRSQGRRIKCIVGPTMAASIPDDQCSLTRVTARDTTLTLLDIINDLKTNHLQEDVHRIYASDMPLNTWDLSSCGLC